MTSEIETNMVSVERISEYQNTPQEAPFSLPENDPPKEWPQYGVVKFENYQTRYREGKKCYFRFLHSVISPVMPLAGGLGGI
jgi:ATP-binding cassette subfamily C (CFTR/MRP) protein 1